MTFTTRGKLGRKPVSQTENWKQSKLPSQARNLMTHRRCPPECQDPEARIGNDYIMMIETQTVGRKSSTLRVTGSM
jgi:hypothetical protein